jgi:hypothetical protein
VGELDLGKLAEAVANSILDPIEIRKLQGENDRIHRENNRLQKENNTLRAEVGELRADLQRKKEEVTASQERCIKAARCVGRIRSTFDYSGDIHNKARLYDEEKGTISGSRIIKILVDFVGKVETSLKDIRVLVDGILDSLQRSMGEEKRTVGTPGSSVRWRSTRISSSSPEGKGGFPLVPPDTTWEHVLQHVNNPKATLDVDTPPTQAKEPEPAPIPISEPRINLCTKFPDSITVPNTVMVENSEKEEPTPIMEQPGKSEKIEAGGRINSPVPLEKQPELVVEDEKEEEGEEMETESEEEGTLDASMHTPNSAAPSTVGGPLGIPTKPSKEKEDSLTWKKRLRMKMKRRESSLHKKGTSSRKKARKNKQK